MRYRKKTPHKKREITEEEKTHIASNKGKGKKNWVKLRFYKIVINGNPDHKAKKMGARLARKGVHYVRDRVKGPKKDTPSVIKDTIERMESKGDTGKTEASSYRNMHINRLMVLADDLEVREADKYGKPMWESTKKGLKKIIFTNVIPQNVNTKKHAAIDLIKEEYKAAKALIDAGFEDIEYGGSRMVRLLEKSVKELEDFREAEEPNRPKLESLSGQAEQAEKNLKILNERREELLVLEVDDIDGQLISVNKLMAKEQRAKILHQEEGAQQATLDKVNENIRLLNLRKDVLMSLKDSSIEEQIEVVDGLIAKEKKPLEAAAKLEKLGCIDQAIHARRMMVKKFRGDGTVVNLQKKIKLDDQLTAKREKAEALRTEIKSIKDGLRNQDFGDQLEAREILAKKETELNAIQGWIDSYGRAIEEEVFALELGPYFKQQKDLKEAAQAFEAHRLIVLKKEKDRSHKKYQSHLRDVKSSASAFKDYASDVQGAPKQLEELKQNIQQVESFLEKLKILNMAKRPLAKAKKIIKKADNISKGHVIFSAAAYIVYGLSGFISTIDLAINAFEMRRHYKKAKDHGVVDARAQAYVQRHEHIGLTPPLLKNKDQAFNDKLKDKAFQLDDPDFNIIARRMGAEYSKKRNYFKAAVNGLNGVTAGVQIAAAACLIAGVGAATAFTPAIGVLVGASGGALIGFSLYKIYKKVGHSDKLKGAEQEIKQVKKDYANLEDKKDEIPATQYKEIRALIDDRAMKCHEIMMRFDPDYRVSTLYEKLITEEGDVSIDSENTRPTAIMLQYLGVPEESIQAAIDTSNPNAGIDLLKVELGYKIKGERERYFDASELTVEDLVLTPEEKSDIINKRLAEFGLI